MVRRREREGWKVQETSGGSGKGVKARGSFPDPSMLTRNPHCFAPPSQEQLPHVWTTKVHSTDLRGGWPCCSTETILEGTVFLSWLTIHSLRLDHNALDRLMCGTQSATHMVSSSSGEDHSPSARPFQPHIQLQG